MPLYEYKCRYLWCKYIDIPQTYLVREVRLRDKQACCYCGRPLERQLSASAVHFKGEGFPGNDSKKKEEWMRKVCKHNDECPYWSSESIILAWEYKRLTTYTDTYLNVSEIPIKHEPPSK